MKKKIFILLFVWCLPFIAGAKVQIDGLWYNLSGTSAEVTSSPNDGVKYIGDVTIPESVTYEGEEYSVTSIGVDAFYNCSGLTTITIPSLVTRIGSTVFYNCNNLTSIYIPESVEYIDNTAFNLCTNLRTIDINENNRIYTDCQNSAIIEIATQTLLIGTTKGYIPNGVTSIGDYAFAGRNFDNQHIEIPEGITSIGQTAFLGSSVSSIHIPTTLKKCGMYAFSSRSQLAYKSKITSVYIDDLTAWFDIEFTEKGSNPLLEGADLYLNGTILNSITIPNEVETIKSYALVGWRGKEIVIPETVKGIESCTFEHCEQLESVTCHIPADAIFAISGITSQKCPLYVPAGAKENYIDKEWGDSFDPIMEMEPTPFTLNVSVAEYATLYLTEAVEIPKNMEVYTAGEVGNGYVYLNPVTDVIPANTGVVVHAEAGTYDFNYYTGDHVSPVLNNLFKGTAVDEYITPSKGKAAYVLSAVDGEVGFYRAQLTDGQFLNNANKAYLEVPELALNEGEIDSSQQLSLKFKFPETTGIEGATISAPQSDVYYNLIGMRIARPTQKGIYLKNGKKFIVK